MTNVTRFFCSLCTVFWLQACNAGTVDDQTFKGHYTYGHEANSFQQCNGEGAFWVIGSLKTLQQMESEYKKYAKEPLCRGLCRIKWKINWQGKRRICRRLQ